MLNRDDIARAARNTDAITEEIGLPAFLAREGIDQDGLMYMSDQRALRMCLITEGRLNEISRSRPTPVKLGWTGGLMAPFGAAWIDGFLTGKLSRHDSSHDIPGIDPKPSTASRED